jgi:cyanophycinase
MSDRTPSTLLEASSPNPKLSACYTPLLKPRFDLFGQERRSDKLTVMAIGGAEDKIQDRLILRTFVKLAGGQQAKILLIPMASETPEIKGQIYGGLFADLGAESTQVLLVGDRAGGESADLIQQLEDCTGVFISGGDQSRLCGFLGSTPFAEQLRQRVYQGRIVLAGTSAGAAVLGHHMITGGGSGEAPNHGLVDLETGFGILPGAIVDQHFHNRNRLARLMSAIAPHPHAIGIGIDEDTCALVNGQGQIQVLGKGVVTILQSTQLWSKDGSLPANPLPLSLPNLQLHLIGHGEVYDAVNINSDGLPASRWLD